MNQGNGATPNVDLLLEQLSQVAVPADVEQRLAARFREFCRQPSTPVRVLPPSPWRHPRFLQAAVATGLAALMAGALLLTFGSQDAWAQVAKAMRSKPWVHWTLQISSDDPLPEGLEAPQGWLSAEKKVFARRAMNQAAQYIDLASQETYDYQPRTNTLHRSLTSDIDNVEVEHFETLFRLLSEGDDSLKLPDSPIQILGRVRRDVQDGDRHWTEYAFACCDPRRAPLNYLVTFRVDPETQLPVEMRSTEKFSFDDPIRERTYVIDYPEAGPGDIYALGAPRDAKVVDRRRAKTETPGEIKDFLAAYVEARRKPLEPFTLTVLKSDPRMDFSDIYTAYRGTVNEEETRVEEVDFGQLTEFRKALWAGRISCPKDEGRMAWWRQQIEGMKFNPVSRGGELLPHQIGYPGELLTLGASPVDNPDCRVSLDRKPTAGPPETVLLRIETETTVGYNDCFFWIAPERDYLVLRHEIHFSRDHAAWNNATQIIDTVRQSPGGRWYATAVRSGRIKKHGDDLPAEPVAAVGTTGMEIGPVTTSAFQFLVDFK